MTLFKTIAALFQAPPQEETLQTFDSPVGEFTKAKRAKHWIAEVQYRGAPLSVAATDFVGAPNDRFMQRLPGILGQLEVMETIAREKIPELTRQHELVGIADTNDDANYDLSLWFRAGDEDDEEVRTVEFDGFDVVRSWV